MLSCLFWESFSLVGWYLETAKNFALHFHSNRKEKEGKENLKTLKRLPNTGKSNKDSLTPVCSPPPFSPIPQTHKETEGKEVVA